MSKQPEALHLADTLQSWVETYSQMHEDNPGGYISEIDELMDKSAIELRRLHEANQEMINALVDISCGLETSRIWGGMEWTYHPINSYKYLPLRDKAQAAIAKATGEMK